MQGRTHRRRLLKGAIIGLATMLIPVTAAGASMAGAGHKRDHGHASRAKPQYGGHVTVLENAALEGQWTSGFDPATTTNGAGNQDMMDAIYGQMFVLGKHGKMIDGLATGYRFINHDKSLLLFLRKGVKFSDGTPFDAAAVVYNYKRDFASPTCNCKYAWPVAAKYPFVAVGKYTVKINLSKVYAPIIHSFYDSVMDWIASPASLKKMGEQKFRFMPVGAGPFVAVKDTVNNEFVVKRNPHYWHKGHPYLDGITFRSIQSGEPMLEAMQAGEAQVVPGMADPSLVAPYKNAGFVLTPGQGTAPYFIQLNTLKPPFNNIKAREAIYYATNRKALNDQFFHGNAVYTDSFTGPGGLFYNPKVSGYRKYDLAKATKLVKEIGGLSVHLQVVQGSLNGLLIQALQNEWGQAGIKVSLSENTVATSIVDLKHQNWQAILTTMGSFDPAVGLGVAVRTSSTSPYSGIHNPKVDQLLTVAASTLKVATRTAAYDQIAEILNKDAYGPFLFTLTGYTIAVKGLYGPGLTTSLPSVAVVPQISWGDVWMKKKS